MSDTLTQPGVNGPKVQQTPDDLKSPHECCDEDALDKSTIAEMSPAQISQMSCDELARVVRAANMRLLRKDISEHVELYDRETLERLVYLARRCCRNQGY